MAVMLLTEKQERALRILDNSPQFPGDFYILMWPDGKFVARDPGSTKGGPSRGECATNWFLGRLGNLVFRETLPTSRFPGKWRITSEGRAALKLQSANAGIQQAAKTPVESANV